MLEQSGPTPEGASVLSRIPRWNWGLGVLSVVLAFGIYVVGATIIDVVYVTADARANDVYGLEIGVLGAQFLALGAALCVVLLYIRRGGTLKNLGFRWPGVRMLGASAAMVVPIYLGIAILYALFSALAPGFLQGNAKEVLQGTTGHLVIPEKVAVLLWSAFEAPLYEETLFRGLLYGGLRNTLVPAIGKEWGIGVAAVISGIAFGLAHFEIHTLPILAFVGIVLALVYERTRSLYGSIIVHTIFNLIAAISILQTT